MIAGRLGRRWRWALLGAFQFAVVAGLGWVLTRDVDAQLLFAAVRNAHIGFLSAAIASMFLERIIRPYRLAALLGWQIPPIQIVGLQSASQLVNLFLPMRSGELFLIVVLRSLGSSGSFALSIVMIDRLMDIVCVLLVFVAAVLLMPRLPPYVDQAVIFLAGASAAAFGLMLLLALKRPPAFATADRILSRLMQPKSAANWKKRLTFVVDGFAVLLDASRLVPAILATIATWLLASLASWLVLMAIWPDAPAGAGALAVCLSVIGVTLVSVPAGVGVVHAAYTLAAVAFGASQEVGLAFAIVGHFFATAMTVVVGLVFLPMAKRSGMTLTRRGREE